MHRLQQQMASNESAAVDVNAFNPVVDGNGDLWEWSHIEVSTLWDIYSVFKVQTAYSKEGDPALSVDAFYNRFQSMNGDEMKVMKEATHYIEDKVVQSLDLRHRFECLIDDDLRIYINVFIALSVFINGFNPITVGVDDGDSFQFDAVIVPKVRERTNKMHIPWNWKQNGYGTHCRLECSGSTISEQCQWTKVHRNGSKIDNHVDDDTAYPTGFDAVDIG